MACQQQESGLSALNPDRETGRDTVFSPSASGTLLAACLMALCTAAPGAERFDLEVAFTADDNITRAQHSSDILEDNALSTAVGWNGHKQLGSASRLLYRLFARGEGWAEYDTLNNAAVGGNLTYQYRASGAFLAPTWALFAKAAVVEYNSELRDSNLYSLGASVRKAFTDRIGFAGIVSGNWRDSESEVFDNSEWSLLLNLDYVLTGRSTLYFTANALDGDVVSTAAPTLAIVTAAEVIEPDDAFGGAAANRFAYRLQARTSVVTLGFNFAIAENHSLDISARLVDSQAGDEIEYQRRLGTIAYLARF
jgi:hypothetical protein